VSDSYLNLSGPAYHPGAESDMEQFQSHIANVLQWIERVEPRYHHGTCVSGYSQPRQHYHYSHYHCRVHHIFIYHPANLRLTYDLATYAQPNLQALPSSHTAHGVGTRICCHLPSCHTKSSTQSACAASGTEWR